MLRLNEKKIIAAVQGDMPLDPHPYKTIGQRLGISEKEVIETLRRLCDSGVIRRFGATLRHQNTGFDANAMGAWQVPEERIAEVGPLMAAFPEVSHCYRRNPAPGWPYNLYTMIHARTEPACREIARRMSAKSGIETYELLFSRRELKKDSMRYFPELEVSSDS